MAENPLEEKISQYVEKLKKSNEMLRLSKKEWEDTFEAIEDLIFVVSPDGYIIKCNRAFRNNFGSEGFENRTYNEVIGEEIVNLNDEKIRDTIKNDGRIYKELFFENSEKYFSVCVFPMEINGGHAHNYIFVLRDQTNIKRMEQKLYHAQKLAQIGEITAGITHEILQPISVVEMTGQLIEMKIEQGQLDFDGLLAKTRMVINQVKEIRTMVENMRNFSRRPDMYTGPLGISTVIDYSLSLLKSEFQKSDIIIIMKLKDVPKVSANVLLLQQVVVNLLKNSIDALNEVKEKRKKIILISTKYSKGNVILRITDNGTGIPKNKLERIFDVFYTTKEFGKGTGLGLSISREIIKKLKGDIYVKSRLKRGTQVELSLPAAK